MDADGQTQPTSPSRPVWSLLRSSIVWKLTVFVGVLVTLNCAVLIGVAYFATSRILRDQIHDRLSTVASDRQEMLAYTLEQQEARATRIASRGRIHQILVQRAEGTISPDRFRAEAEAVLSNARTNATGFLALWVEDEAGRLLVSSGPAELVTGYSRLRRPHAQPGSSLVVPPQRIGETFGFVLSSVAHDRGGRALGAVYMVADFSPIAQFLMDASGLEETGEVVVGVDEGKAIRLILPSRRPSRVTEVTARDFPALGAAIAGEFGFTRTIDYQDRDVLVAYRPVGLGFTGWGLVAKIDSAEAYAPVDHLRLLLLVLGGASLALGLGASNAIARRVARPIRRLARTSAAVAAGDLSVRSEVTSTDEIGALSTAFNRMTEDLERSYGTLERRISARTRELEAVRDLLDAFFRISTSQLEPDNIEKTFDSVLRFCSQLGYDLAMISLIDHDAGMIQGVRALGDMTGVVEMTLRPLRGDDILAVVAREGRAAVVADSRLDERCDPAAVAMSGIRGQVVLPLVSSQVLGTLQVASRATIDPDRLDLRPLETLANLTARALTGLHQIEEIRRLNESQDQHAQELARSESALREQTRILQSVLDCMGDGVVVADPAARFIVFNPAAQRMLGHGRIDSPAQEWSSFYEIFLPDRVTPYPVDDLPLMKAIRGEVSDQEELYIGYPSRDDGTWILVSGRPLRDDLGALQGGVVVFHDITRRKKAERRLAAQYETTRVLAEAETPAQANIKILETICERLDWDYGAFWRADAHTQRLRCAALWHRPAAAVPKFLALTRTLHYERGVGLPGRVWADGEPVWIAEIARDLNSPRRSAAQEDGLQSAFAAPIILRGECLGVLEFFSHEARPADLVILEMMNSLGTQIGQFIERHQMRGRVIQSEKLASLGMLSAGVAHEINNPLAYVSNNLAVIERDIRFLLALLAIYEKAGAGLEASEPELVGQAGRLAAEFDLVYVKENMGKILRSTRQGVKRVADIVQNLRGFARLDHAAVDQADIHEALRTAIEMLRGRLERRNIAVDERLGELPLVSGSPAQLNQVFLNLLVNAMQAIESTHRDDGRIAITTEAHHDEIVVEVADNGCGISEEALPQIFDPFFTTKDVGDGTGLGLSITHSMVQDHGGRLEVESVAGQGTRFRVFLPVAKSGDTSSLGASPRPRIS
jgi:two-component system NtrC family sensor kinase